ncbi:MAG: TRAP transporter substrate-binding protein [Alphaproteobacteria bacterium]|nr:TRAP transporter substrate-binding protein [Alphaproteobacteria bacterium]
MTTKKASASRRGFLGKLALGGAAVATATLASPQVSRAQTTVFRFQSTWPQRDIFHEMAGDYVKRVNEMTGSRFRLELLAAGAVVGAFQMQDAVHSGSLDGGHGVAAYWYGKNKAYSLFGTAPPFFGDANSLLAWYYYGGGEGLYNELLYDITKVNVVAYLTGPMPTQPFGWFRQPITNPDQLKGLKYRTVGLAADLYRAMGAAVTIVAGGEIVPALERGLLDAAEFNNPSSDRVLGFPDVAKNYLLQSFHQKVECFEVLFNKQKFDTLPTEIKNILRYASEAASSDMLWKAHERYPKDLQAIRQAGVRVAATPRSIQEAQLKAWDTVITELSSDAYFKKVVDSQRAWSQRVTGFFLNYEASDSLAYNHFFARRG